MRSTYVTGGLSQSYRTITQFSYHRLIGGVNHKLYGSRGVAKKKEKYYVWEHCPPDARSRPKHIKGLDLKLKVLLSRPPLAAMADHIDEKFFPVPSHAGSAERNPLLPRNKAGATPASTIVLRKVLTDNHNKWHTFFNEKHYHKCVTFLIVDYFKLSLSSLNSHPSHTAHAALSLWCLGADENILEASYKDHSSYQRPQFPSPNPITQQNWKSHLGDER